jgi:hypothetical protein
MRRLTLLLLAAAAASCSEEPAPAGAAPGQGLSAERRPSGERTDAPAAERRAIDPAAVGALHGVVRFEGQAPQRFELGASSRAECRHAGVVHLSETVIVTDGKLQNAYVYVKRGLEGWEIPAASTAPVVLDQLGCLYTPHVLALQARTPLRVRNSDPTSHNVHLKAPRNALMQNKNMGKGQADLELVFERPEHLIEFACDIHPWMGAWVFVEEHPFFAVSDAAGEFEIGGLPPGEYTLEAVHEELGKARADVRVETGASAEVVLRYGG